jgi:hypothetical protein
MIRPTNWSQRPTSSSEKSSATAAATTPPQPPAVALSQAGLQVRCVLWLLAICAIDFSSKFSFMLMTCSALLDLWFVSRLAQPGQGARAAAAQVLRRLRAPPPQVLMFAGIVLLNLSLEHILVEPVARPYLFNIVLLQVAVLVWACLTTPNSRAARASMNRWATIFICVLAAIVVIQSLLYGGFGYNLDIRELLTGEPSRSGIEEGTEGERPTAIFEEPSNLAITVFTLNLVARLTGTRHAWLTAVAGLTCLLNNSGIGLLLAGFLLAEEAIARLKRHLVLVPLIVLVFATLAWLSVTMDLGDFKLHALEQIVHPTTRYDPVAARMYVPWRISNFSPLEHIIGTGIANFAAFKDGFTQYDSSFLLAVYYQTGMLGLPMLLVTLFAAWRVHSLGAAFTMAALFATKMSLLAPAFWALVALMHYRKAVAPPATSERKQRPAPAVWSGLMLRGRVVFGHLSNDARASNQQLDWRQVSLLRLVGGVHQNRRTAKAGQFAPAHGPASNKRSENGPVPNTEPTPADFASAPASPHSV